MTLDHFAGVLTGVVALCLFALFSFSNRKHDRWMTMPGYVRRGLFVTGCMFTWRSVNFLTLGPVSDSGIGHINPEGFIALCSLTYTIVVLTVWSGVFKRLPNKGWFRIDWAEKGVREGKVPVMVAPSEVEEIARERGITVNGKAPPRRVNLP